MTAHRVHDLGEVGRHLDRCAGLDPRNEKYGTSERCRDDGENKKKVGTEFGGRDFHTDCREFLAWKRFRFQFRGVNRWNWV